MDSYDAKNDGGKGMEKDLTFIEVKRCKKCGRVLPEDSTARQCPYCGGTFEKVYRKKTSSKKFKIVRR